ncbi:MAG: DUF1572 family protein [Schleiferiaceae bacterium]|nr:DUF1572 family protein [Schleiferiaceae bacterium]
MELDHFKNIITRDLLAVRKEVSSFKEVSNLWKALPGTINSAGHLSLHLVGNLNHFVGTGLGNTGYVRERDLEFTGNPVSQDELIHSIDQCVIMIENTLDSLDSDDIDKDFPLPWREGKYYNTHFMLLQLSVHLNYHLGQINYHRRYFEK